ncbi:hypothetical protein JOQ06_017566, partial [Pogonophryne albipinna]
HEGKLIKGQARRSRPVTDLPHQPSSLSFSDPPRLPEMPDLYMTAPLHPLGLSAEEVWWLLCRVVEDCSGIRPRLGG